MRDVKKMKRIITLHLLFLATVAHAQFDAIRTLQPDQGQEVKRPVEAKVFNSTAEELPALEKELLGIFQDSSTTLEGRQYTCRMLRFCASEACVPVLAPELTNPELSSFVRLVFQGLETPDADKALIVALPQADSEQLPGIISTLGQRGSDKSGKAIAPYANNDSVDIARAAITALGNIGGKEACKALQKARVMPALSTDWKLARMKCAGSLETKQAAKIFMEYRLDENEQVRIASLVGITKIAPAKFSPEVLIILNSRKPRHRQAAIGLLAMLPVDGLLAGLDGLSPENQILVVENLSERKATEAEAAVLALTKSENEAVRNAAFRALEMIGGADSIQPLLAAALNHSAAYDALCGLNAAGTDAALIQALETGDEALQIKMMDCLSKRQSKEALPIFIALAKGDWSRTSAAAISGMADLASASDFDAYAELMLATDNPKKSAALEKSIATAARRQPDVDACTRPLIAAYPNAKGEAQCAIIRSLGIIGGNAAREMLSQSMSSTVPEIKDAAIRGLCSWPNTDVVDQLLNIAETSDSEKYKVLALRGYIRLANTVDDQKIAVPMCIKAASLTDRPAELKSIIACAKRFKTEEVLNFLVPYLDNPEIADEAGRAIIELSRSRRLKEQCIEPIKRMIEKAPSEKLVSLATTRLGELQ